MPLNWPLVNIAKHWTNALTHRGGVTCSNFMCRETYKCLEMWTLYISTNIWKYIYRKCIHFQNLMKMCQYIVEVYKNVFRFLAMFYIFMWYDNFNGGGGAEIINWSNEKKIPSLKGMHRQKVTQGVTICHDSWENVKCCHCGFSMQY